MKILQGSAAVTRKTVKASESMSAVSLGGIDGLPREDISGKITPSLLKNLESSDWKVWHPSDEAVHPISNIWFFHTLHDNQ